MESQKKKLAKKDIVGF